MTAAWQCTCGLVLEAGTGCLQRKIKQSSPDRARSDGPALIEDMRKLLICAATLHLSAAALLKQHMYTTTFSGEGKIAERNNAVGAVCVLCAPWLCTNQLTLKLQTRLSSSYKIDR